MLYKQAKEYYMNQLYMFGSVVRKIDFGTIDSVKLILAKIDLKIK
jgi:hypothetical protein